MDEPVSASEIADDSGGKNVESGRLKGFRKRWESSEFRSPEHLSVGSSSAPDIPEFDSEQFLQGLDERLNDEGSWSWAGNSVDYAPSTADEPTFESEGKVTVSGGVEHEYAWKLEALQSATKRARLYNEKFPWESSNMQTLSLTPLPRGTDTCLHQLVRVSMMFCNLKCHQEKALLRVQMLPHPLSGESFSWGPGEKLQMRIFVGLL